MRYATALILSVGMTSAAFAAPDGEQATIFDGTIAQSIAALIVFVTLFFVLVKFAWGPILKGLHDREEKIKHDLEHAEHAARQALQTLAEYQKQLAEAQTEARKIIEQGRADAQRMTAQMQAQAEKELATLRDRAATEIRNAKEQAIADLHTEAAVLSTMIAGRILKRELNPDDQRQLVDESLTKLSQSRNN